MTTALQKQQQQQQQQQQHQQEPWYSTLKPVHSSILYKKQIWLFKSI